MCGGNFFILYLPKQASFWRGSPVGKTARIFSTNNQTNPLNLETTSTMSAFARSRTLMARYDVAPHLTKWWKGVRPDEGQVSCYFFLFVFFGRTSCCVGSAVAGVVHLTLRLWFIGRHGCTARRVRIMTILRRKQWGGKMWVWEVYILEVDAEVVLRVGLSIFDSPRNGGWHIIILFIDYCRT